MTIDGEATKAALKLPSLRIWVIVNPTSGGNSGEKLVKKLVKAIRKDVLINSSSFVETTLSELLLPQPSTSACFPQMPETPCSAIIVRTSKSSESIPIAFNICKTFIHSSSADRQRSFSDVVVVIGGDGTLSEVVHGLCTGALEVAKSNSGTCATDDVAMSDATTLSRSVPRLIYLPSGTGADFARLGYNCRTVDDVTLVLKCLVPNEDSASNTPVGNNSSPTSTSAGSTGNTIPSSAPLSTPRFQSCRIDIGSVMYPKTGTRRFFINECSIGMSSDVIIKSENYKKTWLRHFGGLIIFFTAAIVSLIQMEPKPVRLRRLPCGAQASNSSMVAVPCPSGKDGRAVRLTPAEICADLEVENRWVDFPASTIAFGNGKYFGGGMMICPHGDPTDQLFAVTAWYATFWAFVLRMCGVYSGSHVKWASTTTLEGSRFEVDVAEGADRQYCETDGELGEELPAVIEFMGQLNMLRPATRKAQ